MCSLTAPVVTPSLLVSFHFVQRFQASLDCSSSLGLDRFTLLGFNLLVSYSRLLPRHQLPLALARVRPHLHPRGALLSQEEPGNSYSLRNRKDSYDEILGFCADFIHRLNERPSRVHRQSPCLRRQDAPVLPMLSTSLHAVLTISAIWNVLLPDVLAKMKLRSIFFKRWEAILSPNFIQSSIMYPNVAVNPGAHSAQLLDLSMARAPEVRLSARSSAVEDLSCRGHVYAKRCRLALSMKEWALVETELLQAIPVGYPAIPFHSGELQNEANPSSGLTLFRSFAWDPIQSASRDAHTSGSSGCSNPNPGSGSSMFRLHSVAMQSKAKYRRYNRSSICLTGLGPSSYHDH